ncbi:MAG: hypothetical protein BWY76_00996 [bacterium ADurb.Bin429]|nr:MAG: hypothetical protein BWY76_00996 [bacterium ADurb.Bin429]
MKVAVLKNPYTFAYVVSDVPEECRSRLLDDLYWPVEQSFLKQWSDGPGIEIVAGNFEKHGVESLEQLMKIRPAPWEQALSAFIEKLAGTGIRWYIHGSAAMALWGIAVAPRDLNIIFPDLADFDRVRQHFLSETIYPLERCEGWLMGGLGGLFIHANIGLAFNNATDVPFDMRPLKEMEWRGRTIAISPLEWLIRDNQHYGRSERVALIERFMSKG